MQRWLLATPVLLLAGCANSGYWRYLGDTMTLPGANPNLPAGSSETYQAARHGVKTTEPTPLLTEAGDVWPGNPRPVPTLRDLQKQQNAALGSETLNGGLAPLPRLPVLPGFETPEQVPGNAPPLPSFPRATVPLPPPAVPGPHGPVGSLNYGEPQSYQSVPGAGGRDSIVVPNGNGTSTVIGPNGEVSTIPTPK